MKINDRKIGTSSNDHGSAKFCPHWNTSPKKNELFEILGLYHVENKQETVNFLIDKPFLKDFLQAFPPLLEEFLGVKKATISVEADWEYGNEEIVFYLGLDHLSRQEIADRNQLLINKVEQWSNKSLIDAYDSVVIMFK